MKFLTNTTGRCVGNMRVGLGRHILYTLSFNVLVQSIQTIGLYHPADPNLLKIGLAHCAET
jgi:hypothetical protein